MTICANPELVDKYERTKKMFLRMGGNPEVFDEWFGQEIVEAIKDEIGTKYQAIAKLTVKHGEIVDEIEG